MQLDYQTYNGHKEARPYGHDVCEEEVYWSYEDIAHRWGCDVEEARCVVSASGPSFAKLASGDYLTHGHSVARIEDRYAAELAAGDFRSIIHAIALECAEEMAEVLSESCREIATSDAS